MRKPIRYEQWPGNLKGVSEDMDRCIEKVHAKYTSYSYQCNRKRGYGPDGLYCKQHAKMRKNRESH